MRKLVVLVLLVVAGFVGWQWLLHRPLRGEGAAPKTLLIPQGSSVTAIGGQLRDLGLVPHPMLFRAAAMAQGAAGRLRAGEYLLEGRLTLAGIIDKIARGDVVHRELTFPEGRNLEEMAQIAAGRGMAAEAFLAAARDVSLVKDLDPAATDLEGYLFPDTYEVPGGADAAAVLVGRMVKRFRAVIAPEQARVAASGWSLREVVTLASVVELETARGEERPRIAAVFRNRLKLRMPLQTDPTVIYALRKAGTWDGNIRKGDLDVDSKYNTYRYPGLPPGPIASPGREAIRAVLEPADVKDLYFVSRNDGSHQFSANLLDHQRAVNYYQRGRGAAPAMDPSALPGAMPPGSPLPGSPLPPAAGSVVPVPAPSGAPAAVPPAAPASTAPSPASR